MNCRDKEYKKYKKQTDKIANAGQILAFGGFLVGGSTLAMYNDLKPEIKLLLGIPAGASFITGLVLISIAQARYNKMIHNNAEEIHRILSKLEQKANRLSR